MKFYLVDKRITRSEKKELETQITSLDRAILKAIGTKGEDIVGILNSGKPFVNKYGRKQFATTVKIKSEVVKLVKLGILEYR